MSKLSAPRPSASANADYFRGVWGRFFGSFMQSARENGGWSVEQTAELAGMDAAEWLAVEAGTLLPDSRQQLQSMADALEMEWSSMAQIVVLCQDAWGFNS